MQPALTVDADGAPSGVQLAISDNIHAVRLLGGEGLPLSALAARNAGQRAEHFPFEPVDRALVTAALDDARERSVT